MGYVQGFLIPVPTENRSEYLNAARASAGYFARHGVLRTVEGWGTDVPDGKLNDLKMAVELEPQENVVFAWQEWPDRASCQAAMTEAMEDPESAELHANMPFDTKRLIWAGFEQIVDHRAGPATAKPGYFDGILLAVPAENKVAYVALAERMAEVFVEHGALRVSEGWAEHTPDGAITDFNRATLRKDDEQIVFSWIEWPDKAARDVGWARIMEDPRGRPSGPHPFDGNRMIWGGFETILDLSAA